jgi:hypothetical protein
MRPLLAVLLLAAAAMAQRPSVYENHPALVVSNDKLDLTIYTDGGAFASLVLRDDPGQLNPLWNPERLAREAGQEYRDRRSLGHFVCVDGFGPSSAEEQKAGLMMHGEAHYLPWELVSAAKQGNLTAAKFSVKLPIVQEVLTRTVTVAEGENVVYVESELESLLGFDRPVNWAEHATVSAPFLEPGVTVVDMPATRSMTRPYTGSPRRFPPAGAEFRWPMAPLAAGGQADIRTVPVALGLMGHTTSLMDRDRKYAFATVLHPVRRLIIGWVFKPEEFPWVQDWENYPASGKVARGLEFSTQPFDVSRREAIGSPALFGAPMYRWLPARQKISSRFLMFYARVPEGLMQVDDVRLEGGKLVIEDRKNNKQLTLAASQPF